MSQNNWDEFLDVLTWAIFNRLKKTLWDRLKYKRIKSFLRNNLLESEQYELLGMVMKHMDHRSFFGFTASIMGMNLIGVESTIGQSLEESSDISEDQSLGKTLQEIETLAGKTSS